MFSTPHETVETSREDLQRIASLVKRLAGINLEGHKLPLIRARLVSRLRALGLDSLDAYRKKLEQEQDGEELAVMLDLLSTNVTRFFREPEAYEYLEKHFLPGWIAANRPALRIWSAGCSTGEEPYSIAFTLADAIPEIARRDVRILATDLSTRALDRARKGVYTLDRIEGIPPAMRKRHLEISEGAAEMREPVKDLVRFARLNLMGRWPMSGPFQAIFCRNVMIYFDRPTQERLVRRFHDILDDGGLLFLGHSECLTAIRHPFRRVSAHILRK